MCGSTGFAYGMACTSRIDVYIMFIVHDNHTLRGKLGVFLHVQPRLTPYTLTRSEFDRVSDTVLSNWPERQIYCVYGMRNVKNMRVIT